MMPDNVAIVDTMIGFPHADLRGAYAEIRKQIRDRQTQDEFEMPVEYMFKAVPEKGFATTDDPVAYTLEEMDRWGVRIAMVSCATGGPADAALAMYPDRFVASFSPDPNEGVEAIRKLHAAHDSFGVRAVTMFPAGFAPQVPINHRRMWPIYTECVRLGLPVFVNVGIPGPRVASDCQYVGFVEDVLIDFPDLVFVMRHGAEPWVDHAVKLMVKWPNLYYSTSAFAPKHYPKEIISYANSRGADRIIYGGYFPMGLSLERIMTELRDVGFKDEVWPKFLQHNATKVLQLDNET
jgi:uncharacterized protein